MLVTCELRFELSLPSLTKLESWLFDQDEDALSPYLGDSTWTQWKPFTPQAGTIEPTATQLSWKPELPACARPQCSTSSQVPSGGSPAKFKIHPITCEHKE